MALPETPQQQVEWEARLRPRAAIAAAIAGIFILVGQVGPELVISSLPRSSFLESLGRLAQPGPVGELPSLQVPAAEYLQDNYVGMLVPAICEGLGFFALAYCLTFLGAATRARREQLARWVIYLPAVGGVLVGVAAIARGIGRIGDVEEFLDGPRTVDAAQDIGLSGLSLIAEVIYYPASLATAAGIVMIALNAMRAGLLTRFMGTLGIIVGVLQVIRIGPIPLVQTFWFLAFAWLLLGRRPGGDPPAWRTGREEPWPAPQPRNAPREPDPEPDPPARERVPAGAHSASSKRKRKRRT